MTKVLDIRPMLDEILALLEAQNSDAAIALLTSLHPADSAAILYDLERDVRDDLFSRFDAENGAALLAEFDADDQAELAHAVSQEQLNDIIAQMEPDDAADVLNELEPAEVAATLAAMSPEDSEDMQELLEHDEDSAGGLMTSSIITLHDTLTAQEAIDTLRRLHPEEEAIYYLFVVDTAERLVGVVSLRALVMAPPTRSLSVIMDANVLTAHVETDQEECARLLARYDLLALPIVDDERRIVGMITADDIIDVIEEEATEDMYRLANLPENENVEDSLFRSSRRRLFWLMMNLPTAILAAWVVSQFDSTTQRVIALVPFMPIVAGMGGNAGIQTLTLIVRSLALGEIDTDEGLRALGRELAIGVINGLAFGSIIGLLGLLWKGNPVLGLVVGLAMLSNLIAAAIAGTVVPLTLRLLRIDPALASGVIVTTFTDVTGYTCLLGLATLLITYLT